MGLMMSGISLGIALVYYYVINHPEFAQFRHWFIMLIITAVINLFAGWGWVYSGFINGEIGDCVMYAREASGSIISQLIYASDCWMFGVANAIVSIGFFCIFSLIVKWKSSNAGHSPF
ncbi:MAG: hypothetical protein LBS69_08530 [Prevotellaceae bacterium]|nr:hypothetical protein [Prevotellaceae bacterium]